MTTFRWQGRDRDGRQVSGQIDAPSKDHALELLLAQKVMVTEITSRSSAEPMDPDRNVPRFTADGPKAPARPHRFRALLIVAAFVLAGLAVRSVAPPWRENWVPLLLSSLLLLIGALLFALIILSFFWQPKKSIVVFVLLLSASAVHAQNLPDQVSTVAGVPGISGFLDGPAHEATFNHPTWLDAVVGNDCSGGKDGDIYVIDRLNQSIRKISRGTVSTYAVKRQVGFNAYSPFAFDFGGPFGGGIVIEPVDGGCGCLQWDRGMFIASTGSQQLVLVSLINLLGNRDSEQVLGQERAGQTFRPTGLARSWAYPSFLLLNKRHLYVSDSDSDTIRKIDFNLSFEACPMLSVVSTFAGGAGLAGSQDGLGPAARFNAPRGLAAAPDGSVYVADSGNHTIRRITPDGVVTTVAGEAGVSGSNDGPALQAHLNTPSGIDVDAEGEIVIADTGNHVIRMLTSDGMLVTIAGAPGVAGFADGNGDQARFNGPVGLRITPDGSILIADTSNNLIRRFTPHPNKRRAVRH